MALPNVHLEQDSISSLSKNQQTQELRLPRDEERALTPSLGEENAERRFVGWNSPEDKENPQNWSEPRKLFAVLSICSLAFSVSFSSSIFAPAAEALVSEFHVSKTVANLGVSLYVLGFAAGPLIWGPLSEAYGRKVPLCAALLLFTIFQIPVAVAKNMATILVSRLICGAAGSAAFAIPPAMAVDFLTPAQRLFCINFYMTFTFVGPVAGPLAGTYLTIEHGWHWTAWTSLVVGGLCAITAILAIPESCADILLQKKAKKLREKRDGVSDDVLAKRDVQPITAQVLITKYLTRPFRMLIQEPILLILTLYSSLIYGILYLLFFSLPYTFITSRHWSSKTSSLPFLAILIGVLIGCGATAVSDATWWLHRFLARGRQFLPEDRLPQLMISSVLLPIGLFWFAWTSSPSIPWPAQVFPCIIIGAGIVLNMFSTTAYFIDVYALNANSALAAYISVRSIIAFAFPLFAVQMFEKLGVSWAASLLAFLCVALAPAPFLFWWYGAKIRSWSRFAFETPSGGKV